MLIEPFISLTKGNNGEDYVADMISSLNSRKSVLLLILLLVGYGSAFFVTEVVDRSIESSDVS